MYAVRKILFWLCSVFDNLLFLDMADKHLRSGAFRLPTQISKAENKHLTCWGVWLDNIDGRVIRGDNRESDNSSVFIVPGTSCHMWVNCLGFFFLFAGLLKWKKGEECSQHLEAVYGPTLVLGKVLEISCTFCLQFGQFFTCQIHFEQLTVNTCADGDV